VHIDLTLGPVQINNNTSPGYAMAIINLLLLLYFVILFKEPTDKHPDVDTCAFDCIFMFSHRFVSAFNPREVYVRNCFHFTFQRGIGICFLLTFLNNFALSVLETIATPITEGQFGWKTLENSILYVIMRCFELRILLMITIWLVSLIDIALLLFQWNPLLLLLAWCFHTNI